MQGVKLADRRHEQAQQAKVIDTVGGYFDAQETFRRGLQVASGVRAARVRLRRGLALTCSVTACGECGADHAAVVQEELAGQCSEEEALHPWRYGGYREGLGLPF